MSTPIDITPPGWDWNTVHEVHGGFVDFCTYEQAWVYPTVEDLLDLIQGVGLLFYCHGKEWDPQATLRWVWSNYTGSWNVEDPDRLSTQPYEPRRPTALLGWDVALKAGFCETPTTGQNFYRTGELVIPYFVYLIHEARSNWHEIWHGSREGHAQLQEQIRKEQEERDSFLQKQRTGRV